jgi:hypothetical protein
MIMADQLRADWISCTGANFIHTLNIDALAVQGVCFTANVLPNTARKDKYCEGLFASDKTSLRRL